MAQKKRPGVPVNNFWHFLGEAILETTALEVSTIVVPEILPSQFVPAQAYREIYVLQVDHLPQSGVDLALSDRYLKLHHLLLLKYTDCLNNPQSPAYQRHAPIPSHLPDPDTPGDAPQWQAILKDSSFLRCLRKLTEIKAALDQPGAEIYARTISQLDGDVCHTYAQRLIQHPQQQVLLQIHQAGVAASQSHWHSLIEFLVNLAQKALPKQSWLPKSSKRI